MTDQRMAGKVAIVTGSARGIGRAIVERFAAEGAGVVVNYVTREDAARDTVEAVLAARGDALAVRADVSRSADVKELVRATRAHFGRIDILVNNAGIHIAKGLFETTEEDWDRTIDLNLKSAYLCSKEVAPVMMEQGEGTIIMISSNSGLYHPSAMFFTEYVASKAGMNGLTKALALALGPHITVNAICPGWIRTDMLDEIDDETHQRILGETALQRWGRAEDVAASAVFLASEDASFITGELLIVAGGRGMH